LTIRQAQMRGVIGSALGVPSHLLNDAIQGANNAFRKACDAMLDFSKALTAIQE